MLSRNKVGLTEVGPGHNCPISLMVERRSFKPNAQVRFLYRGNLYGYSLIGKTLVSKISIVGSSPTTRVIILFSFILIFYV